MRNIRYVLTEYVERALELADYDKLEDSTFAGNIRQCLGVVSFGKTLSECQSNLRLTLEDWVLLGLKKGHKLPRPGGIDLNGNVEPGEASAAPGDTRRKKTTRV